jgi:negative regulator of replication initiation
VDLHHQVIAHAGRTKNVKVPKTPFWAFTNGYFGVLRSFYADMYGSLLLPTQVMFYDVSLVFTSI